MLVIFLLMSNFNIFIMSIKSAVLFSYMPKALIERFTKLALSYSFLVAVPVLYIFISFFGIVS